MSLSPQQFFHGTSRAFDGPVMPQPGEANTVYRVGGKDYFPPEMEDTDWDELPTDVAGHIRDELYEGRESFAADNEADAWVHAGKSGRRASVQDGRDESFYMANPSAGQRVLPVSPRGGVSPDGANPENWVSSKDGFDVHGEVTIPPPNTAVHPWSGEQTGGAVQGRLWGDDLGRRWKA